MNALAHIVLSPLLVGIVLALALALAWRRLPRALRVLGLALVAACYVFSTALGAQPLVHLIEGHAAQSCPAPAPQAVVVLAGGANDDARPGEFAALNEASLRRLFGGVRLWRQQTPGTPLVLSGGAVTSNVAEASLMAALARALGVPADTMRTETRSLNTWQNAQYLAAMQPPLPRRVWLVTSAMHMPRALYAMRRAGFAPCAAPVDYRQQRNHHLTDLLPSAGAIALTNAALHELVGLAWYHLAK